MVRNAGHVEKNVMTSVLEEVFEMLYSEDGTMQL